MFITVDRSEEESLKFVCAEFSNDDYYKVRGKEAENIPEESFAVGNVAKGDFILVNLAANRNIYCYITEVINYFHVNGYEIRYYKRLENNNIFIFDKK